MPYIYKITNTVNGKVYIGQTVKKPNLRFTEHVYLANHPQLDHRGKLHGAMRKYGIDKFLLETIEECKVEDLNVREIFWISQYDSFENGYNCTLGGGGMLTANSDDILKAWNSGMTISGISRELGHDRQTISCHLAHFGIMDKDIEKRQKEVMSKNSSLPVYQYDFDGHFVAEYSSLKEAKLVTGINISSIRGVLSGQHPTAGCYQWRRYKTDNIGKASKIPTVAKKVHQYSLDGVYIKTFKSINQARLAVGLKSSIPIRRVCNGEAHTSAGYRWSFE